MRLKLKDTPEQNQMVMAMGSKNMNVAREAQEAFAAFIGPVIQQLLLRAGSASTVFTDSTYNGDSDSPSYPLDLYYNENAGLVQVWSQNVAGGLPTSELYGLSEMKIATYRLDSAVSFHKRYARKARLDVVAKAVERMANEVLIKQELNAWAVILKALAEASSTYSTQTNKKHVIASAAANVFTVGDLNNLLILIKRINSSIGGGTAVQPYSKGITDLYVSPEIMGQIRAFAYNPIFPTTISSPTTSVTQLPDSARESLYQNGGVQSLYGINLVELNEFGDGQLWNVLFNTFTTAQNVPGSNSGAWQTVDQILVGIDNTRGAFIRAVDKDSDTGSTFNAEVDDQFNLKRVDKAGFYGSLEEGRVAIDARACAGIAV
jgi:hypothetical protein